jgi:hypothetical protein
MVRRAPTALCIWNIQQATLFKTMQSLGCVDPYHLERIFLDSLKATNASSYNSLAKSWIPSSSSEIFQATRKSIDESLEASRMKPIKKTYRNFGVIVTKCFAFDSDGFLKKRERMLVSTGENADNAHVVGGNAQKKKIIVLPGATLLLIVFFLEACEGFFEIPSLRYDATKCVKEANSICFLQSLKDLLP